MTGYMKKWLNDFWLIMNDRYLPPNYMGGRYSLIRVIPAYMYPISFVTIYSSLSLSYYQIFNLHTDLRCFALLECCCCSNTTSNYLIDVVLELHRTENFPQNYIYQCYIIGNKRKHYLTFAQITKFSSFVTSNLL